MPSIPNSNQGGTTTKAHWQTKLSTNTNKNTHTHCCFSSLSSHPHVRTSDTLTRICEHIKMCWKRNAKMRDEWNYLPVHQLTAWFFLTDATARAAFFHIFIQQLCAFISIYLNFTCAISFGFGCFCFAHAIFNARQTERQTYASSHNQVHIFRYFIAHSTLILKSINFT